MKKLLSYIFISIVSASCSSAFADFAGYTITDYHVDMSLRSNGSMDVHETISVNFTEPRHGIYREIPVQDAAGEYTHIAGLTAIDDPVASNTLTNGVYTLKIGSASTTITGPKTYHITYTVLNAIKTYQPNTSTGASLTGRQELYWNIIGTKRATSIAHASYTITWDKSYLFPNGDMFVVYGFHGTTGVAALEQVSALTIMGKAPRALQGHEGLTVGLKFPANHFTIDPSDEKKFETKPTLGQRDEVQQSISSGVRSIVNAIGGARVVIVWLCMIGFRLIARKQGSTSGKSPAWKSKKSITIQYVPPKDIEPTKAFWFRYRAANPRVFSALIYYWATHGRVHLNRKKDPQLFGLFSSEAFHVTETQCKPTGTSPLEDATLQAFFGSYDDRLDDIVIDKSVYSEVTRVMDVIQNAIESTNTLYTSSGFFIKTHTLTPEGESLFEHLRGYKEYLSKVDRPQIERALKDNPDYINAILPWAVLFGVETKLLPLIEDLLQQSSSGRYTSYNGLPLQSTTFRTMNAAMVTSSTAPRSSGGSGGSGFSGGGSSGGGGGGGGGGSR